MNILARIPTWVMMLPILICSVISLTVIIERYLFFKKHPMPGKELAGQIVKAVREGRIMEGISICKKHPGILPKIIIEIFNNRTLSKPALKEDVSDRISQIIDPYEKHLGILATISSI